MAIEWRDELLRECYKTMIPGGEVRIQFVVRGNKRVPIVRSYPENQKVCKEIEVEI